MMKLLVLFFLPLSIGNTKGNTSLKPDSLLAISVTGEIRNQIDLQKTNNNSGKIKNILSGVLNISMGKVELPFSWTYRENKNTFTHPFNQFRLSPTYKWARLQVGYFQANLSPLSLSSIPIKGGALSMTPGKWKIDLIGGISARAVDPGDNQAGIPLSYQKNMMAFGIGYKGSRIKTQFSTAYSMDKFEELVLPSEFPISFPKASWYSGLEIQFKLFKNISLKTANGIGLEKIAGHENQFLTIPFSANSFLRPKHTMINEIIYKKSHLELGVIFEKKDPDYHPPGMWFYNSDLNRLALDIRVPLNKKKGNIQFRIGKQSAPSARNNRVSGRLNIHYQLSPMSTLQFCYSNFTSVFNLTPAGSVEVPHAIDSSNFYQIQQNLQTAFSKKSKSGRLTFSIATNIASSSKSNSATNQLQQVLFNSGIISSTSILIQIKNKTGDISHSTGIINQMNALYPAIKTTNGITYSMNIKTKKGGKFNYTCILSYTSIPLVNTRINYTVKPLTAQKLEKMQISIAAQHRTKPDKNSRSFWASSLILLIPLR